MPEAAGNRRENRNMPFRIDARVVEDGPRFVSGGGVTSGLEVAMYLFERELGPKIANAVERLFEYERRGTV